MEFAGLMESIKDIVSFLMVDYFFPAVISWKFEMDRLADFLVVI